MLWLWCICYYWKFGGNVCDVYFLYVSVYVYLLLELVDGQCNLCDQWFVYLYCKVVMWFQCSVVKWCVIQVVDDVDVVYECYVVIDDDDFLMQLL